AVFLKRDPACHVRVSGAPSIPPWTPAPCSGRAAGNEGTRLSTTRPLGVTKSGRRSSKLTRWARHSFLKRTLNGPPAPRFPPPFHLRRRPVRQFKKVVPGGSEHERDRNTCAEKKSPVLMR